MAHEGDDRPRDKHGRVLSSVAQKGHNPKKPPINRKKPSKSDTGTPDDIAKLMDAPGRFPVNELRNRAMIWLLYRQDLKMHQLVALQRRDYDGAAGTLTIRGEAEPLEIPLDSRSRELLDAWAIERDQLSVGVLGPLFCGMQWPGEGEPIDSNSWRSSFARRRKRAGVTKWITPEGLRASGRKHARLRVEGLVRELAAHIDDDRFRTAYPDAYDKWQGAFELLRQDGERHASTIGLNCREAVQDFASALAETHGVGTDLPTERTKQKIRLVLDEQSSALGETVSDSLRALFDYWAAVNDLVQRQVHKASRERGALTGEDSRRLVFQTMLVMYEIDSALQRALNTQQ